MPSPVIRLKSIEGAVVQVIIIGCDSSAAVGDLVRINESTVNFVDVAVNNSDSRPVIGIIIQKLSATIARVAVSGVVDDPESNTPGVVYLSATGTITRTPPASGYLQKLGYSFGNGLVDFKPEKTLINLI